MTEKRRAVRPWDLLNKNMARTEDAMQKERMAICRSCPDLIKVTEQCKHCGCFMELKTKLADAYCPLGKWDAVKIDISIKPKKETE
jgi:hypothetical protein